jgi:N-acyl amino acid synthase FeeM
MSGIEIRRVVAPSETQMVQRQRFEIYVEELGYPQRDADPVAHTVCEPLDRHGVIFGAFDRDRLVGSVRVNFGELGEYVRLYPVHRFEPQWRERLCVVTKLMLLPAFRCRTLLARMGIALYEFTRDWRPDARFCLIDCIPALRTVFLRLGYRQIGPALQHPAAGTVLPMAFAIYDLDHFRSVRSPLARACPRHDEASSRWFEMEFAAEMTASP